MLQENKLANKFVSAGSGVSVNKFVREGQEEEQIVVKLEKVFDDDRKNRRYWDYVM
jgi:hypothetical protein